LTETEEARILTVLKELIEEPLSQEIAQVTIAIRRTGKLKLPDCIIVATASVIGATLLTRDEKFLKFKWPGLEIRSPLLQ
jgi:predicted nucleic acid-binding protein